MAVEKRTSMRIEHIAIRADDIELLRAFYTEYFNSECGDNYVNCGNSFATK